MPEDGSQWLIKNEKPEGLKEFGKWNTVYEALSQLPPHVQKSWFGFDHFYSDDAFPLVLPLVLPFVLDLDFDSVLPFDLNFCDVFNLISLRSLVFAKL